MASYYIVNKNQTRNPGLHHEVHTLEHANKLGIVNRISLGYCVNEVEAVRKAGYEITMEPTDNCIPSNPPYPARIAFCIGPVGEEIEFFCVK